MDFLKSASLDWALAHVQRYGDTDMFPVPFEFESITSNWKSIRDALAKRDLENYVTSTYRRILIQKPGGGFRVAIQLDPLDSLVYTAMVYEVAEAIERHRIPSSQSVACSYRVQTDPKGSFFPPENGWSDFHTRSEKLAKTTKYTHVLLADISDFYNQVYTHRVENALESAGVSSVRAKSIETFLLGLGAQQSRGLPVGPIASILLAEACLNDVDRLIIRKGCPHVRYVDDFRIFCKSRKAAIRVQHDLTEYLYTSHRLSLEPFKTKILSTTRFLKSEHRDPAEIERQAKTNKLNALLEEIRDNTGYDVDLDDLDNDTQSRLIRQSLRELFDKCIAERPLHLGLARHVLRRATSSKTAVLIPRVFENLEILGPVFRDVSKYIVKCLPKHQSRARGKELIAFFLKSDIGTLPFIRLWGIEILVKRPDMVNGDTAMSLASSSLTSLGIRPQAEVAYIFNHLDFVREQKETWRNHGPWDRRAIIRAARILPSDERKTWLRLVQRSADPLEKASALHAG